MKGLAARTAKPRLEMPVYVHRISNRPTPLERLRFDPPSELEGRQQARRLRRADATHGTQGRHRGAGQLGQPTGLCDNGSRDRVGSIRSRASAENQRDELCVRERT